MISRVREMFNPYLLTSISLLIINEKATSLIPRWTNQTNENENQTNNYSSISTPTFVKPNKSKATFQKIPTDVFKHK